MIDKLYSPWRLQYILSKKGKECIFCIKPNENNDRKHLILYRGKFCFVIMNVFPYNNGHLMVVPNRHISRLNDLQIEELNELFTIVQLSEKVLEKTYNCDGINVGINLGKAGGAGIEEHLHVHLVPRWIGDVNFMTTIGGTRVIPENFEQSFTQLKKQFDNETLKK